MNLKQYYKIITIQVGELGSRISIRRFDIPYVVYCYFHEDKSIRYIQSNKTFKYGLYI